MPTNPIVIPVTMVEQAVQIGDLIPGEIYHFKVEPYSPFDIPGDYNWVNVSMYPDNFTKVETVSVTNISLSLTTTGSGEWFEASMSGIVHTDIEQPPQTVFDYST